MNRPQEPLEREIVRDDRRLEDSPVYRELYRRMFREMGYDAASLPGGRVLEQLERFEARLKRLEDKERKRSESSKR